MLRFAVLLLLIVANFNVFSIESNFYSEESCTNARGYCVLESECPHSVPRAYKSLCPDQQKGGAVCCRDFPQDQVNCNQLHNICMDINACPSILRSGTKGCPDGQTCCVLI